MFLHCWLSTGHARQFRQNIHRFSIYIQQQKFCFNFLFLPPSASFRTPEQEPQSSPTAPKASELHYGKRKPQSLHTSPRMCSLTLSPSPSLEQTAALQAKQNVMLVRNGDGLISVPTANWSDCTDSHSYRTQQEQTTQIQALPFQKQPSAD